MPHPAADLDDRIAAAFKEGATSDVFDDLLRDCEFAAKTSSEMAAASRERALDPISTAKEVASARAEMNDAQFRFDRLQVAIRKLTARYKQLRQDEENSRRKIIYDKVVAARDQLAAELASVYPPMVDQLVELLTRIEAHNRERAATKLPDGAERILEVELIARGMLGYVYNGVEALSIIRDLRLPSFHFDVHAPYAWPAHA